MAGDGKDKEEGKPSSSARASLAARRRRIEMLRERRELLAQLDDFGDGEADIDLELLDEDDDEVGRWVAAEEGDLQDGADEDEDGGGFEDDDEFYDDADLDEED